MQTLKVSVLCGIKDVSVPWLLGYKLGGMMEYGPIRQCFPLLDSNPP
jgi:hypothetical protein